MEKDLVQLLAPCLRNDVPHVSMTFQERLLEHQRISSRDRNGKTNSLSNPTNCYYFHYETKRTILPYLMTLYDRRRKQKPKRQHFLNAQSYLETSLQISP